METATLSVESAEGQGVSRRGKERQESVYKYATWMGGLPRGLRFWIGILYADSCAPRRRFRRCMLGWETPGYASEFFALIDAADWEFMWLIGRR